MPLVEQAPAKINLGLHVLRKRSDGYHEVETVLHRIDWYDTVTVEEASSLSLTCSDPALPTGTENLCMQAAVRLSQVLEIDRGAALHLEKRIPYGAGLGGGSSDAAATLRLLTRLWGVEVDSKTLHEVARDLGADIPFFLREAPAAYATGIGDELTSVRQHGDAYRLPFPVLVVAPPVKISTPDAYGRVTPQDHPRPQLPSVVVSNDLQRWRRSLVNDFEHPVEDAYPVVAELHDWLDEQGADYVSLSGSGSAVFGVFARERRARAALEEGRRRWDDIHLHAEREHEEPEKGS